MIPLAQVRVGPNVTASGGRGARWIPLVLAAAFGVLVPACSDEPQDAVDLSGERVEVVAVWQDTEADAFRRVLRGFEEATGASVEYTSTEGEDITAFLDRRIEAGDEPDLAVLPQPGLLQRYARSGVIVPLDEVVGEEVAARWGRPWQQLGSVDGRLFGVWFKAADKSLVWYSLRAFEDAGLVPPDDLDGLAETARRLADAGVPAFSLTGAASEDWIATDWFENLYLRIAGPDRYDDLALHRIPWTHPSVEETLREMATLLRAGAVIRVAGPETTFPEAVSAVFSIRPSAAMLVEGDFVPGVAPHRRAEVGIDVDAFDFPGVLPTDRYVVGGGDAAVMLRPTEPARALLRHLASTEAAEVWARLGGFLSPNEDVDLGAYPDPTTRRIARSLLDAGDRFRFDLSDLQPVAFGGTTGAGMWKELGAFARDPSDVAGTMERLEAAAAAAWED